MTQNEKELVGLIRENDNPAEAVLTAIEIILSFLEQHGSSQEQAVVALQG